MSTDLTPEQAPRLRLSMPMRVRTPEMDEDLWDLALLLVSGAAITDPRIGHAVAAKDDAALQRIAREARINSDSTMRKS
jgi:hypothetical protein